MSLLREKLELCENGKEAIQAKGGIYSTVHQFRRKAGTVTSQIGECVESNVSNWAYFRPDIYIYMYIVAKDLRWRFLQQDQATLTVEQI